MKIDLNNDEIVDTIEALNHALVTRRVDDPERRNRMHGVIIRLEKAIGVDD